MGKGENFFFFFSSFFLKREQAVKNLREREKKDPTYNALLINFRLISDAEILLRSSD